MCKTKWSLQKKKLKTRPVVHAPIYWLRPQVKMVQINTRKKGSAKENASCKRTVGWNAELKKRCKWISRYRKGKTCCKIIADEVFICKTLISQYFFLSSKCLFAIVYLFIYKKCFFFILNFCKKYMWPWIDSIFHVFLLQGYMQTHSGKYDRYHMKSLPLDVWEYYFHQH